MKVKLTYVNVPAAAALTTSEVMEYGWQDEAKIVLRLFPDAVIEVRRADKADKTD